MSMFFSKHSITFDTYLLSCCFHCVDIFCIKFRSYQTFRVTNSGARLSFIETLSNFRTIWFTLFTLDLPYTYTCMFQVSVISNVLYIPPSFPAFHIPLVLVRQQLKISKMCTLFQPIKLQIFCILNTSSFHAVTNFGKLKVWVLLEIDMTSGLWGALFG